MVITVGRQYGSGGREIGTALANKLGIVYYDDLLLKKAAEQGVEAKYKARLQQIKAWKDEHGRK